MDLTMYRKGFSTLRNLLDSSHPMKPQIDERSDTKPPFPYPQDQLPEVKSPFRHKAPESLGISSEKITEFFRALCEDETLDIHNLAVFRKGFMIASLSKGAFDMKMWHITHSESKTLTGIAIGILENDGLIKVTDKIIDILGSDLPPFSGLTLKKLSVSHLLTMTSGSLFNEIGSITEKNWVKGYLESASLKEHGKTFNYNSLNTYMLSAVVQKLTGKTMCEFLEERLFTPLKIETYYWEKSYEGITKGGWGLYIRPEDLAKIGQLLLNSGVWKGTRIVSAEWITRMATPRQTTPEWMGTFDYGYQMWYDKDTDCMLMNGLFGQNIFMFRSTGIMILTNCGNNELFQQSNMFKIIAKEFGPDYVPSESPLAKNPVEYGKLLMYARSQKGAPVRPTFIQKNEFSKKLAFLDGTTLKMTSENASSAGLMPRFVQATQNNYTKGLEKISFSLNKSVLSITFTEKDEEYVLQFGPGGLNRFIYTDLEFHGEPYRVGGSCLITENEDGIKCLKLNVSFVETASRRTMKIFFKLKNGKPSGATIQMDETPGKMFVLEGINSVSLELRKKPFASFIISRTDPRYFDYKMEAAVSPVLTASAEEPSSDSSL